MTHHTNTVLRRYIITVLAVAAGILLVVLASLHTLLWMAGEHMDPLDILRRQQRDGGYYRSALRDDIMAPDFRLARYHALKPEIVTLGSSRVLQFRQSHFIRPFANMGMNYQLDQLPGIARRLVASPHDLKLVILSIDHWKFDPLQVLKKNLPTRLHNWAADINNMYYISAPLRLVVKKQLGADEILTIICRCDDYGPIKNFGLAALIDGSGIDVEGSYHYEWVYTTPARPDGFAPHLKRIQSRENGFEILDEIPPTSLGYLKEAVQILQTADVQVVLMVPPMPEAIVDAMNRAGGYGVISRMDIALRSLGATFYNFHDANRTLESPDCEFVDGIHGGEVTYLRILRAMQMDRPDLWSSFLDSQRIDDMIREGAGRVNVSRHPTSGDLARTEADFLGLGCQKD